VKTSRWNVVPRPAVPLEINMTQQLHGFVNSKQEEQTLTQAALACAALELTIVPVSQATNKAASALSRAIEYYRSHSSPELLIVDISDPVSSSDPIDGLAQLAEVCQASTRVLLLGQRDDLGFYRQLMSLGVDDYLVLPVDEVQLRAQLRRLSEPHSRFHDDQAHNDGYNVVHSSVRESDTLRPAAPRGRNMVITATHSGIGCSLIAALVAGKLSRDPGMHLALLDLDSAGSLDIYLNSPANAAFASLLADPDAADDLLVQRAGSELHSRLTLFSSVVDVNAAGKQNQLLQKSGVINALTAKLAPQFSALFWDLPAAHNTTPMALELLKNADHIVLVTHPHPSAARELKRLQDFYQQHGLLNKVHLLVNQPYNAAAVTVEDMAAINPLVNTPLSALDHDKSALKQLMAGTPNIDQSRLSRQVNRFIDDWLALTPSVQRESGILQRLLNRDS